MMGVNFSADFLAWGGEPSNLDTLLSIFLHPHALSASSIMSVWLLLPHILFRHACCKIPHEFLLRHNLLAMAPRIVATIGVIYVSPSSSTTANTSASFIDFSSSSLTKTCLVKWEKLVDAILLRASALLFLLLGTCLIENFLKLLESVFTFSRPAIKASYSGSLLVASNLNLRAYVNSAPFGFGSIRSAPKPSTQDDPSGKFPFNLSPHKGLLEVCHLTHDASNDVNGMTRWQSYAIRLDDGTWTRFKGSDEW
ncbi:hypothetical protein Tco_0836352 [Tanacetum coccineum]